MGASVKPPGPPTPCDVAFKAKTQHARRPLGPSVLGRAPSTLVESIHCVHIRLMPPFSGRCPKPDLCLRHPDSFLHTVLPEPQSGRLVSRLSAVAGWLRMLSPDPLQEASQGMLVTSLCPFGTSVIRHALTIPAHALLTHRTRTWVCFTSSRDGRTGRIPDLTICAPTYIDPHRHWPRPPSAPLSSACRAQVTCALWVAIVYLCLILPGVPNGRLGRHGAGGILVAHLTVCFASGQGMRPPTPTHRYCLSSNHCTLPPKHCRSPSHRRWGPSNRPWLPSNHRRLPSNEVPTHNEGR